MKNWISIFKIFVIFVGILDILVSSNLHGPKNNDNYQYVGDEWHQLGRTSLPKNREVVHFTVDFKWIIVKFFSLDTWKHGLKCVFSGVKSLVRIPSSFITSGIQKKESTRILSMIKEQNKDCNLNVFSGSLADALNFAALKNRFLVVYVENHKDRDALQNRTEEEIIRGHNLLRVHSLYSSYYSSLSEQATQVVITMQYEHGKNAELIHKKFIITKHLNATETTADQ